MPWYLKEKKY